MEMVMCQGTGLLSAGVGVRLGEAGSLSIAAGVQSTRVWVVCGRAASRACTTGVLSQSISNSRAMRGALKVRI